MDTQKTYFSTSGALIVSISKGRRITDEGGVSKMVGQKVAEFTPMGDGYGRLITEDPEVIAVLDQRAAVPGADVFDATEYTRRTTPAEVRLRLMEQEHNRLVQEHNRLLAKLQAEGKLEKQPSK